MDGYGCPPKSLYMEEQTFDYTVSLLTEEEYAAFPLPLDNNEVARVAVFKFACGVPVVVSRFNTGFILRVDMEHEKSQNIWRSMVIIDTSQMSRAVYKDLTYRDNSVAPGWKTTSRRFQSAEASDIYSYVNSGLVYFSPFEVELYLEVVGEFAMKTAEEFFTELADRLQESFTLA